MTKCKMYKIIRR